MPVAKGTTKPEYSHNEKAEMVERVCQLYESQNCTVESCCKAVGISESIFRLWLTKFGEFGERYKKARAKQDETYWDMLRPLAKTSLQRLLEGEETEETTIADLNFRGTLTGQTAETVRRGKTQPNPTAVIFTLKGLYPDMFADRSIVDLKTTDSKQPEFLTPELIDKIDALLGDGKGDNGDVPISGKSKGKRGGA